MSQKPHVQTSPNLLRIFLVAVAQFRSRGIAIAYVMYFRFCGWRHTFD